MDNKTNVIITSMLDDGIMQLTLNRPQQLNALNTEILQQLSLLLKEIKQDNSIKAILITGEGKAFCAGADIKQLVHLGATSGLIFARYGQAVMRQLELLGKPSLAAIHGVALGGGCELAMATTIRIAASSAVFGQPEIKLGVIPGFGGTQRLARLVGKGRALDICLTDRRFSANEALQWGLVSEVVSPDELLMRATSILQELAHLSPFALQSIMSVIQHGYDLSLEEALELEATHFGLCCATSDKQEGVTAFLEKRIPVFSGE